MSALRSGDTSLIHVWAGRIATYVLPAVIAIFASWGLSIYNHEVDQRKETVDGFTRPAMRFESVGFRFIESVLYYHKPPSAADKSAAIENLTEQSHALSVLAGILPISDRHFATTYEKDLENFSSMLNVSSPSSVDAFYAASKNLIADRDQLIMRIDPKALTISANIPPKPGLPHGPVPPP